MNDVGRRVVDRATGEQGTVTDEVVNNRNRHMYQIAWDIPTPHQADVWVAVPSEYFDWATESSEETT